MIKFIETGGAITGGDVRDAIADGAEYLAYVHAEPGIASSAIMWATDSESMPGMQRSRAVFPPPDHPFHQYSMAVWENRGILGTAKKKTKATKTDKPKPIEPVNQGGDRQCGDKLVR